MNRFLKTFATTKYCTTDENDWNMKRKETDLYGQQMKPRSRLQNFFFQHKLVTEERCWAWYLSPRMCWATFAGKLGSTKSVIHSLNTHGKQSRLSDMHQGLGTYFMCVCACIYNSMYIYIYSLYIYFIYIHIYAYTHMMEFNLQTRNSKNLILITLIK